MAQQLDGFVDEPEIARRQITLPVFRLPPLDDAEDRKELAIQIAERRVIRAGLDAWRAIGKAESFEAWAAIGKALAIGKAHALRTVDTDAPWWQRRYGYRFNAWLKANGFFSGMTPSVRSVAIELAENLSAIEAWRATLPERQRRRLIHPLSNVRRWKAATMPEGKSHNDFKMEARAALKKVFDLFAQAADKRSQHADR